MTGMIMVRRSRSCGRGARACGNRFLQPTSRSEMQGRLSVVQLMGTSCAVTPTSAAIVAISSR
jgi:hypothetical protein